MNFPKSHGTLASRHHRSVCTTATSILLYKECITTEEIGLQARESSLLKHYTKRSWHFPAKSLRDQRLEGIMSRSKSNENLVHYTNLKVEL
jgi:hypothetical protein